MFDIVEKVQSVAIWKLLVECNDVDGFVTKNVQRRLSVFCRTNVEKGTKNNLQRITGARFIINY
jgi:hypothetical protein